MVVDSCTSTCAYLVVGTMRARRSTGGSGASNGPNQSAVCSPAMVLEKRTRSRTEGPIGSVSFPVRLFHLVMPLGEPSTTERKKSGGGTPEDRPDAGESG